MGRGKAGYDSDVLGAKNDKLVNKFSARYRSMNLSITEHG
jgi:hypothetical protein